MRSASPALTVTRRHTPGAATAQARAVLGFPYHSRIWSSTTLGLRLTAARGHLFWHNRLVALNQTRSTRSWLLSRTACCYSSDSRSKAFNRSSARISCSSLLTRTSKLSFLLQMHPHGVDSLSLFQKARTCFNRLDLPTKQATAGPSSHVRRTQSKRCGAVYHQRWALEKLAARPRSAHGLRYHNVKIRLNTVIAMLPVYARKPLWVEPVNAGETAGAPRVSWRPRLLVATSTRLDIPQRA